MVSQVPEMQLKMFFGLTLPISKNINFEGSFGGHLNPCTVVGCGQKSVIFTRNITDFCP